MRTTTRNLSESIAHSSFTSIIFVSHLQVDQKIVDRFLFLICGYRLFWLAVVNESAMHRLISSSSAH